MSQYEKNILKRTEAEKRKKKMKEEKDAEYEYQQFLKKEK